jgi:alpha-2-macroglobulin
MRVILGLLLALAWLLPGPAVRADELEIPGLRADSGAFARSLRQRFPAGATARQRADSEARAQSAETHKDWAAAASAWSDRLGQGETAPEMWLSLARDLLKQTKSDPAHALAAAWQAFEARGTGPDQVPALLVMRDALAALNRPVPEVEVLEAASDRSPDDADLRTQLALRKQQLGLLVRKVRTEPESFPARACIAFIGRPGGAADFHAGDWVRLDPKVPDAAVTLESGEVCITGLRPGATTRISLVAGMPGADGVSLKAPETLAVAMPDRQPRLVFDGARFLQPSGAPSQVSLASVNLSAVKLDLVRVTERAAQPFLAAHPPGDGLADTDLDGLRQSGELVWQGRADIPGFARNELLHTRLPLPQAALERPGLYLFLARPGDGTPRLDGETPQAVQMVLRTDLAPTAWQGEDGLSVQVRGYADAQPKPGARVALIAADNDVLATETTGADGIARFTPALLHGEAGMAPAALHLTGSDGGDFTVLSLTRPAFDLADRGVSGRAQPGPVDAFVWLDRGIYRPGETVQATALLRDAAGHPAEVPVHVIVKRPGGQIFADIVPKPGEGASLSVPITLSGGAQAGTWSIALRTTPDAPEVGRATFQVEAFVPARLAVELGKPAAPLPPGQTSQLPVSVRFLYGAPGAGLSGEGTVRLEADPTPFADFGDYKFGLAGEEVPGSPATPTLPETDAQGNTTVPVDLTHLPDVTGALLAKVTATMNDPAGRPVSATASVPIRPAVPLIGIRTTMTDGAAVEPGQEAAFDVVAVSPQGSRVAMPVRMTLVRQVPDWRLVVNRGMASYETVWRDEPVDSAAATIPADGGPLHFTWRLGFGRYKLQVVQAGKGLAAASRVFTAGWEGSGNPDVPARVRVSTDRPRYGAGDTARVHIEAPFAGPATLLVLTDRVHLIRDLDLQANASGAGLDVDVPVGANWGPGAYVAVHAYRPARDGATSDRAIGVTWVQMDPAARTLPVAVETPPVLRPRGTAMVTVRTAPGAWLTLAAVDEGVLRLTNFATPDPVEYFMGKRALGVDIRDEWGRLLRPAEGTPTLLRQGGGGDEEGEAPPPPQRVVALFTPPVQAGPDGIARVPLDLPDFNGQLRLMVVAWSGDQVGSAGLDVFVRDPLVAEALLPRFLAPGDTARLGLLLQNVELPSGPVRVRITAAGALSLAGADMVEANLGEGEKSVQSTTLRAGDAGEGRIALDVTGPGGFTARHEVSLFVHPARGRIVAVSGAELAPGTEASVTPDADAFVAGTWTASLSLGGAVRYGVAGLVQALADYPLSCLEQVTSRGLPLAMLPDGAAAGPDRAGRLETAVELALDRQRYDGAFGLWSSEGEAQPWLTAYATDFLLRAKRGGAAVPQTALDGALGWLADEITHPPDDPKARVAQAYAVYVLALAGRTPAGAIRVMASSEDDLPTPLARAQLAAALARVSQPQPAAALLRASFTAPDRKFWLADYGSALRDQFATAVLIEESGTDAVATPALASGLPGANLDPKALDTQEQAWAAAAAAALGEAAPPVSARVDGRDLKGAPLVTLPLTGMVRLRNTGASPLWQSVSVSGVPRTAPPASRHLMQVKRRFFDQRGQALDPDKLPQNTSFVLLIEGKAEDGQDHQAMLRAGLPAGWEIAGRMPEGKVPGMDWLGGLSSVNTQAAADDRYAVAFDLTVDKPDFRVAVLLRAVTPGEYEYPGIELSDMYRPAVYARQNTVRISVLPAP